MVVSRAPLSASRPGAPASGCSPTNPHSGLGTQSQEGRFCFNSTLLETFNFKDPGTVGCLLRFLFNVSKPGV